MSAVEKLELCVAAQNFYPVPGGAVLRFLRYFPGFHRRGVSIRVVTGTPHKSQIAPPEIVQKWSGVSVGSVIPTEPLNGARIHRVRLPDRKGWSRKAVFRREIRRVCTEPGYRPDVLQLVSSLPFRSSFEPKRLRQGGTAIVFAYTISLKRKKDPIQRAMNRWFTRMLSRQIDCVIVGTAALQDQAKSLGFDTRIETIANGVDLTRFHPPTGAEDRIAVRRALGIPAEAPLLLCVGSLTLRKGSDLMLETWSRLNRRLSDAHLVFVGAGFETEGGDPEKLKFAHRLDGLTASSGAADRLHFTGFVDNVEDYYRSADLLVFPSKKEGMPNAVIEAMASGLPVVLTPFDSLSANIGEPGQDFLLVERTSEALEDAASTLLKDAERRRRMGARARCWIEATMDLEATLDRYVKIYRELSAHRRKAAEKGHER